MTRQPLLNDGPVSAALMRAGAFTLIPGRTMHAVLFGAWGVSK